MKTKVYNFNKRVSQLFHEEPGEVLEYSDYFQWYTTGVEELVKTNDSFFIQTDRYEKEKTDALSYIFFNNENYSDMLLALNNDVFLWDMPVDASSLEISKNNYLNYIERLFQRALTEDEKIYWGNRLENKLEKENDYKRKIITVSDGDKGQTLRMIKAYFKSREVK
jgi:hypothetical protein